MTCKDTSKTLTARLNKRVEVQRIDHVPNKFGEPVPTPVTVATVWAAIEPLRGNEFFAAFSEQSEVTTRIRIRYREGIDRTMTVKYGDIEFEILHIIHPEMNRVELQLMCKERQ